MIIRTDCYLAKLKIFRQMHPKAHFEVITRSANHILSPSWELLEKRKEENWSFQEYRTKLLEELSLNPKVIPKLQELKKIAERKELFLVCFERNDKECHRIIIKELIERLGDYRCSQCGALLGIEYWEIFNHKKEKYEDYCINCKLKIEGVTKQN